MRVHACVCTRVCERGRGPGRRRDRQERPPAAPPPPLLSPPVIQRERERERERDASVPPRFPLALR
eukprot:3237626-Rhodomonas_salina.1